MVTTNSIWSAALYTSTNSPNPKHRKADGLVFASLTEDQWLTVREKEASSHPWSDWMTSYWLLRVATLSERWNSSTFQYIFQYILRFSSTLKHEIQVHSSTFSITLLSRLWKKIQRSNRMIQNTAPQRGARAEMVNILTSVSPASQ